MIQPRRLSGVSFETVAASPRGELPRTDVAALVGYTSAGPFDLPVRVLDSVQLASIFGEEPVDSGVGDGLLASAARAYFRNGGEAVWIVRAGAPSEASRVALPGLLSVGASGGLAPCWMRARSPGTAFDQLRVTTELTFDSRGAGTLIAEASSEIADARFTLDARAGAPLGEGELILMSLGDHALYGVVERAHPNNRCPLSSLHRVTPLALSELLEPEPVLWTAPGERLALTFTSHEGGACLLSRPPPGTPKDWPNRLAPGDVIELGSGCYGVLDEVAPGANSALVQLRAFRVERLRSVLSLGGAMRALPSLRRLELTVNTLNPGGADLRVSGLGFHPSHPRALLALPNDDALYGARPPEGREALYEAVRHPRFPLASAGEDALLLPLHVFGAHGGGRAMLPAAGSRSRRDGRLRDDGTGDARLLLDERLTSAGPERLYSEAGALRAQRDAPRLRGLHALCEVDEPALVAMPDAALPSLRALPAEGSVTPSARFEGDMGSVGFEDCARLRTPRPTLVGATLVWAAVEDAIGYRLERLDDAGLAIETLPVSSPLDLRLLDRGPGEVRWSLRAIGITLQSALSEVLVLTWPELSAQASAADPAATSEARIIAHRALLNLCLARGDRFAVLCQPCGAESTDIEAERAALADPARGEDPALSYGMIAHPWVVDRPDVALRLRLIPPAGHVLGRLSALTRQEGPWRSPGGELLLDVVSVDRTLDSPERALGAGASPVVRDVGGFKLVDARTLSNDPDLDEVSVRRLLVLLRRLARARGEELLFEPNSNATARALENRLVSALSKIQAAGGLGGRSGFRVKVRPGASSGPDEARLIAEIAVNPAHPLRWLTVRLVQNNSGALVASEG